MGKTAIINYQGNLRTSNMHIQSGKVIITDAPVDNNGQGRAFSPTDLVATATASCMLTIMGIYADKNGLNIDGTSADVEKIMVSNPRRIGKLIIDIYFSHTQLTPKDIKHLKKVAMACPVKKSISPEIELDITFHTM